MTKNIVCEYPYKASAKRLFIDIDGTLAEFNKEAKMEDMYGKNYFLNLRSQDKIIKAVKIVTAIRRLLNIEVYVISSYLTGSIFSLAEKNQWLDKNIPEIRERIFLPCGDKKHLHVPSFNPDTDILIDDYGCNCHEWKNAGGRYIKVSTDQSDLLKERLKHDVCISPDMSTLQIVISIMKAIKEV